MDKLKLGQYELKVKIEKDTGKCSGGLGCVKKVTEEEKIERAKEVQKIINSNLTSQQDNVFRRDIQTFTFSTLLSMIINKCNMDYIKFIEIDTYKRLISLKEILQTTNEKEREDKKLKEITNKRNFFTGKLSTIIQSNQSEGGILLVPCPLVGEKGGLHMTLAVIDLANKEFAIFDSNIHSEENDCQYTDAREKIQIEGFKNVGLLNSGEKAFKPQTQFNDCTYWVEATILVLSEIISNTIKQNELIQEGKITGEQIQEINIKWLSSKLQEEEIQDKIRAKHNEILATNSNMTQQKTQTKQDNGFGDFDTTEQNSTTPPVPQPNITEKTSKTEQTTNTSTPEHTDDNNDLKAVAKRFSSFSSSTVTRCQDNKNATPQSATVNIPPSKTQSISRPQPVPSIE